MRLDDLLLNGLSLLQDPDAFCFGSDAVALADFVPRAKKDTTLCDLGSGNGILSILLCKKGYRVTAVEIQQKAAALCMQNVTLNQLEHCVSVVCMPMQAFCTNANKGAFDAVVCNPPYEPKGSGEISETAAIAIARSEEAVTLREVVGCAAHLTKYGGRFYIVQKISRLAECMHLCVEHALEPKVLQILSPAEGKPPHLFLLSCLKNGKSGLRVLKERVVQASV